MAETMRLKMHLGMAGAVLLALVGSMAGTTYWRTGTTGRPAGEVQRPDGELRLAFRAARAELLTRRSQMPVLLQGLTSADKVPAYRERWQMQRAREAERLDALDRVADHEQMRAVATAMRNELGDYDMAYTRILALVENGTITKAADAERAFRAWAAGIRH